MAYLALLYTMKNQNAEKYFKLADSKSVDIMVWMLLNRNDDDRLYGTLDSIAASCDVTKVTVSKLFRKMYKAGFLAKIRNGQYQLENIDGIL